MIVPVLVVILVAAPVSARAQCAFRACPELSSSGSRVAGLIGATPLLERLRDLPVGSPEAVSARQSILEAVLSASLETDAALADLQNEEMQVSEVQSYLAARRERFVSVANLASVLVGAGVGVVGSALQFSTDTENLGNAFSVAAGATSTALVVVAGRRARRGSSQLAINSNMLAPFFEPKLGPTHYPDVVWCYLTMPLAGSQPAVSWRDRLLSDWVRAGRLETSGSQKALEKTRFLTSTVPALRRVSIGYLSDRGAMLAAVRARIALMKRDLAELMCTVRTAGK